MSSENNNSSSGSKKKKVAAAAVAVALAAALMIGGTISYLVSSSDTIVNTFSTPTIKVDLVETTDGYTIIPGTSEEKDPTVKITTGVDAYVYLVVEDSTDGLVTYTINDAWSLLYTETDEDGSVTYVYYMEVSASSKRQSIDCLEGQTVYYSSAITNEDVEDYESGDLTLSFTAYAIQKASFSSAEEAYPYAIGTSAAVDSQEELEAALEDEDVTYIVLTEDVALEDEVDTSETSTSIVSALTVSTSKTINLSGYTLSYDTSDIDDSVLSEGSLTQTMALITVTDGATLTIEGGTFDCDLDYNSSYCIYVKDGNLIINDGTFYGAMTAVQVQNGSATINGGTFILIDDIRGYSEYMYTYCAKYLINIIDANATAGTGTVTINGGTFDGFDPSKDMNNDGVFLASGYSVSSSTDSTYSYATWYTVSSSSSEE